MSTQNKLTVELDTQQLFDRAAELVPVRKNGQPGDPLSWVQSFVGFLRCNGVAEDVKLTKDERKDWGNRLDTFRRNLAAAQGFHVPAGQTVVKTNIRFADRDELGLPEIVRTTVTCQRKVTVDERLNVAVRNQSGLSKEIERLRALKQKNVTPKA